MDDDSSMKLMKLESLRPEGLDGVDDAVVEACDDSDFLIGHVDDDDRDAENDADDDDSDDDDD
eukprot:8984885-Karenia_brevis.AAC.1